MVGLSLALHAPFVFQERLGEVWEIRGDIAYVVGEGAKSVLSGHPLEKSEYTGELKEALELGNHIDLGEFYLKSQYLDGRLEEGRMREALDKLDEMEADVRADKDKMGTLDVLDGIKERDGKHEAAHSYLSTVVLEGKGNCKARERFSAALVDRVYPGMEIIYQKVKLDGVRHTRTLVKVDGKWRNMEDPKGSPLSEADLAGTVLYEKYDYVKHYVGQSNLGNYRKPPKPINSHTKLSVTADYLDLPLPDGVDADNIKDVAFDASGAGGAGLGSVGQGVIGSPAPVGENGQSNIGGVGLVRDPIELEILSPDDVEENRKKTLATLEYWRKLDSADQSDIKETLNTILPNMSDSCVDTVTPFVKEGAKRVLEDCRLHENSGLLSCEYGADNLISTPARYMDIAGANCLPDNLNRCSSYNRENSEGKFRMDAYIKLIFVLSLKENYKDWLPLEEVTRVALELGVIEGETYEELVEIIYHRKAQFIGRSPSGFILFAPEPEYRFSVDNTFDGFYCQAE